MYAGKYFIEMSLSSNNWPDINTLLSYRDFRAIGHEELIEAGLLVNKKQKGIFSYYFKDTAIDDFISAELYEELAGFSQDKAYNDFILLTEIILDTLSYSKKPSVINRRLKLFCFKNMMFRNEHIIAGQNANYREDLFRFFLFFHPCGEDFITSFSFKSEGPLLYKGETMNLHQQIHSLFEVIINSKARFAALNGFTEQALSVSRDITLTLLQSILHPAKRAAFTAEGNGQDLLTKIFSEPQIFFDLYLDDQKKFFRLMEENIDQYIVRSWDDDAKLQASVYYGPAKNNTVENYFNRPSRLFSKRKYLVEFFMDMYVFYVLRQPAGLEDVMTFFADKPGIQLKITAILFSHPFYNGEAKLQLVRSGKDTLLPGGFWTERLKKMRDSVAKS
jgi:hypothetical protein